MSAGTALSAVETQPARERTDGSHRRPRRWALEHFLAIGLAACVALLLFRAPVVVAVSALVLVGGALLMLLVHLVTPDGSELRQRVRRWTLASFGLHVVLGLAANSVSFVPWLHVDSVVYHADAIEIVAHWTRDLPLPDLPSGKEGFAYMLAGLYRYFGSYREVGIVANCAMGAALVPLVTDATRRLFGRAAAWHAPPFLVLLPGLLIWPSLLLREAAILFLIAVCLNCAVRLTERITLLPTVLVILSLATLFTFRSHVAAVLAVGLIAGLLLGSMRFLRGLTIAAAVLSLLAVAVFVSDLGYRGYRAVVTEGNLEALKVMRAGSVGRTSFDQNTDLSTPEALLAYMPVGMVKLALGPFPWKIREARDLPVLPDVAVTWLLLPHLWRGLKAAVRRVGRRVFVLVLPAVLMTASLGVLLNEFALISRERPQIVVLLVPLLALASSHRAARRAAAQGSERAAYAADRLTARLGWNGPGPAGEATTRGTTERDHATGPTDSGRFMVQRHLRIIGQHKTAICAAAMIGFVAVLVFSRFQTPSYSATAEVGLQPGIAENLFGGSQPVRTAQTETRFVRSKPVRDAVRAQLGRDVLVSAVPLPESNTFNVIGTSDNPEDAAAIVNAYVNAYLEFRRQQAVDELEKALQGLRAKSEQLQGEIDAINQEMDRAPAGSRPALEQTLVVRRANLVSEQGILKQKLDQLEVESSLRTAGARVLSPAEPPPVKGTGAFLKMGAIGLAGGLVIGLGLAYAFDRFDDRIRDGKDVDNIAHGLPVVGFIPLEARRGARYEPSVMLNGQDSVALAEAYQMLGTATNVLATRHGRRTIQITSATASEEKTATAANLAMTLARAGIRVVLVDCDFRKPRVHEVFGISNARGFADVVDDRAPLAVTLQGVPGEANLKLLASGPAPTRPANLLGSKRAAEVINALAAKADVVLLDSPETTAFADPLVLSSHVDASLLVAAVGKTSRRRLIRAIELLRQIEAPLAGIVVHAPASNS